MKPKLQALLMSTGFLLSSGCSDGTETALLKQDATRETSSPLAPLALGMSQEQLSRVFPSAQQVGVLVHPSNIVDGYVITLPSGITAHAAIGRGNRVEFISSEDRRAILSNGLGPGASLERVSKVCPGAELRDLLGYGRLFRVSEMEWIVFYPSESDSGFQDVVGCIELRTEDSALGAYMGS